MNDARFSLKPKYGITSLLGLFVFVLLPCWGGAQRAASKSERLRPQWLVKSTPTPSNSTFSYTIGLGEGVSLEEARIMCLNHFTSNAANTYVVKRSTRSTQTVQQKKVEGRLKETDQGVYVFDFQVEGAPIQLHFERIDEYWEYLGGKIGYRCYTLYAVANSPAGATFDQLSFSRQYGVRGVVRSAIVPGWGQLYKGNTAKGVIIMGSQAALVSGIIVAENMRQSYDKKIRETHDVNKIRSYADRADNAATMRNAFIGGAAILYVCNLVDALVANGSKRAIVKSRKFTLAPVATPDYTGIGLAVEF